MDYYYGGGFFTLRKLLIALVLIILFPILYVMILLYLGLKCGFELFKGINQLLIFFGAGMADSLRIPVGWGLSVFFFILFVFLTRKPFIKIMKWLAHSIFGEGHLRDLLK
jgi:hypothetical protein